MPHVLPPYRADVVGSFLRPAAVAQARAAFARGEFSREALTAVEDEEIAALVKKELDNGLTAVTDGEFRRAFWHLDFLAGLKGIRHVKAEAWSVHFEGRQPKAETVVIEDRLSFPADHPFLEAFDRLKKIAGDAAVKYTIPSCTSSAACAPRTMSRSPPTRTTRSFFSTTSHKPGPTPC